MSEADEWVPFTYDLDQKNLVGGSFQTHDNQKP